MTMSSPYFTGDHAAITFDGMALIVNLDSESPNGTVGFIDDETVVLSFGREQVVVHPLAEESPDSATPVVVVSSGVPEEIGWAEYYAQERK